MDLHQDEQLPQQFGVQAQKLDKPEPQVAMPTAGVFNGQQDKLPVRFASQNEEIEPAQSLQKVDTITDQIRGRLSSKEQEELRNLSTTLQNTYLQQKRMNHGAFEPVSLPASRMPSNEQPASLRHGSYASIRQSPGVSSITPPLSAATSREKQQQLLPGGISPNEMTPAPSGPAKHHPDGGKPSFPTSRDPSPRRSSGQATPPTAWSRPSTPGGTRENPYARNRQQPPSRNVDTVDARFKFDGRDSRRSSRVSTPIITPSTTGSSDQTAHERHGKHHTGLFGGLGKHHHEEDTGNKHSSMVDLKRFFRFGHRNGGGKRSRSPSRARLAPPLDKSGYRTPPHASNQMNVPFGDEHGLQAKWGKFGKVLGSGAGGSVRLMKRSSDGVTFAVKQFRDRHPHESEKEYNKKVTAEFCIGSTLHHGNIIETLDIIHEKGHWYEVMEYAPYDLFATVMTGKMSREEVACSFLQILAGTAYIHSMGLAHRDLKLDNVVINEYGIMKLIDFGSAVVYKYPFEDEIVLATGIVGSDPYLAPEVYDNNKYNPAAVDIWSLAIIFACMSLRRFPWKAPRLSDNSYRLFVAQPEPGSQADLVTRRTSAHSSAQATPVATGGQAGAGADGQGQPKQQEVIKGPWRLLRLLPRETRGIISRMLEVDPNQRATLEEVLGDPWVIKTPRCQQLDHGQIIKATNHTHVLEAGGNDTPPAKK